MPQISTLFALCWNTISYYTRYISDKFMNSNYDATIHNFEATITSMKSELSALPPVYRRDAAMIYLSVANEVAGKYGVNTDQRLLQLKSLLVVGKLVSVAARLNLKQLRFSDWTKPVQVSLLDHLWRMTSLETLHCDPQDPLDGADQGLKESLPFLVNLEEFSYSHESSEALINTLVENAKSLRVVTFKPDPELRERYPQFIARVRRLFPGGLTTNVYNDNPSAHLLEFMLSESNGVQNNLNISSDHGLEAVFLQLEKDFGTDQLHPIPVSTLSADLSTSDFEGGCLKLVPKYFPYLKELVLRGYFNPADVADLLLLDRLESLEVFKLTWKAILTEELPYLLELRCTALTSLSLQFLEENEHCSIDIADFVRMGARCPNLEYLRLSGCSFFKNSSLSAAQETAFSKLKKFELESSTTSCVELILQHASNIETISLIADAGLTDEFILGLFRLNPLEHLRELYVSPENRISLKVLQHVASHCRQISFLGHFEPSDDELKELDVLTRKCLKNHQL